MLLSLSKVSKTIGEKVLFQNLDFGISEGEKCAIVGVNGSGKSTLLRCILKQEEPDGGQIIANRELKISLLEQNPKFKPEEKILDHIYQGGGALIRLIHDYTEACQRLESATEKDLETYTFLMSEMDRLSAWEFETQIKNILRELGVPNLNLQMKDLSGGMLKKVELAKSLIEECNLLILDEPTNHLDVEAILWLEDFLANTDKAVLLITHDRYFLDRVVDKILEIHQGKHYLYDGNYSIYLQRKAEREETLIKQEEKIKQHLKQELKWLKRQPKARTTKQKARIDRAEELGQREKFELQKELELIVINKRQGKTILEIQNLQKSFSEKKLIQNFSYVFKAKERLGVVGKNGVGKSTLLNLIAGRLSPDQGMIKPGLNTKIGYFDQTSKELPEQKTVLAYIKETAGEMIESENGEKLTASKVLERFLFDGKLQHTPIYKLSGGEKRRLYLVQVLMIGPNFLILDEPTNDLDIQTLSILETFLEDFPGTVLTVSHDRYFMDRVAESLLVFEEEGHIRNFTGSYTSFLESKKNVEPTPKEKPNKNINVKVSNKKEKERKNLEKDIEILEKSKKDLEKSLEEFMSDHTKLAEIDKLIQDLNAKIEEKYAEWDTLSG